MQDGAEDGGRSCRLKPLAPEAPSPAEGELWVRSLPAVL